jgi:hypothetical protein
MSIIICLAVLLLLVAFVALFAFRGMVKAARAFHI